MTLHHRHWQLLTLLADGQRHHISQLGQQLGIAPQQLNLLWKQIPDHIQSLLRQHDGHWHLSQALALWLPEALQQASPDWHITLLHEHPSSNTYLHDTIRAQPETAQGQAVFVHQQSAGRGRQGKTWHSQLGHALTFSTSWCFNRPQAQLGGLAIATAVACCRALQPLGVPLQLKWPNDLVIGKDKLGGILIETLPRASQTAAIIGIGLNWLMPQHNDATCLHQHAPHINPTKLPEALLHHLAQAFKQYDQHGLAPFIDEYHQSHRDQDCPVILTQGEHRQTGIALGINPHGALRLRDEQGHEHAIVSGEISLRPAPKTSPPILLLDAGNSKLKWAWAHEGQLTHIGKAPYWNLSHLSEIWQKHGNDAIRIIGSAVCGAAKQAAVAQALGRTPEWLGAMTEALGIRNHYRHIHEHGADRWFNVLGSRRFTQNACVIVSCGTAVTVDALTADNHYLGGSILPGYNLMKEAMAQHTANLNRPIGRAYPFGTTTANALAGGLSDAVSGAVLIMHQRLQNQYPDQTIDIIITGGGAAKVKNGLPEAFGLDKQIQIVDNLVLYGLLDWVERT